MKRARTLMAASIIAAATMVGCDNQLNLFAPHPQSGRSPTGTEVVSEPMAMPGPTSAPASSGEKQSDPQAAGLDEQINQYVSQLSGKDRQPGHETATPSANNSSQTRPTIDGPPRPATRPALAQSATDIAPPRKPLGVKPATQPADAANSAVMASPGSPAARSPSPGAAASGTAARGPRVEVVDVRPAARSARPTSSASPNAAANSPTTSINMSVVPVDMASMISQLEQTVQQHPEQLDDQLKLRLLYLATGQDAKATAPIPSGDPAQAEFIVALLKTLRNSKNLITDPASKDPSALAGLDELRRLLGQQLPVSIPRIALVTRINSFGDYQALNPPKFPPGRAIHAFLYTEVYNFRSEPTDDGKLRTVVSEKVEIFDSAGKIVWQRTEPSIVDRVVTPRRDFFIPFPINLPGELPTGDYILKVTVEDKIGATADQQKLTFTVGE
jgi:hypothetical protein